MKLNKIILCMMLIGTIISAEKSPSTSYRHERFLWYNDKKLYWPDSSEIHRTCWNDFFSGPSSWKYKNDNCTVMLGYIDAIQYSVYFETTKRKYQKKILKNKAELAKINASINDNHETNTDQSMKKTQQTAAANILLQKIHSDENALENLSAAIVPINFPTDGTQEDKDKFKKAITELLPDHRIIEEITIIKSILEQARNEKLYKQK